MSERIFIQVDLKQAESRFVAYDSADIALIECLEDPNRDIHSEVGGEIFSVPTAQVRAEAKAGNDGKRQLGKKSGHGANYDMGVPKFIDTCLKELGLVIDKQFATKTLEAYHTLFPGIRRWHRELQVEMRNKRCLTNPLGRVRYFYGRMDDNTYREGYAYRPQSTVPDIANHLILALQAARTEGKFDFWFHLQCHDSATLSAEKKHLDAIAKFCFNTDLWHPKILLRAGRLVIPTEVEFGPGLGELQKFAC